MSLGRGTGQIKIKENNQRTILRYIMDHNTYCSDIAGMIGLSISGANGIINNLEKKGIIIKEDAEIVKRGRRPQIIKLNADYGVVAVITISRESGVYIFDFSERLLFNHSISSIDGFNKDHLDVLLNFLKEKVESIGKKLYNIQISVPGKVDKKDGKLIYSPFISDYKNFDIVEYCKQKMNSPVHVNTICYYWYVAEKRTDTENLIYNTLIVEGLGSVIAVNGDYYPGGNGVAGEIGMYIMKRRKEDGSPILFDDVYHEFFSKGNKETTDAYINEEKWAKNKVGKFRSACALVLANIVTYFDLDNIVLGGRLLLLGKKFREELEDEINDLVKSTVRERITVHRSTYNEMFSLGDIHLVGATYSAVCEAIDIITGEESIYED